MKIHFESIGVIHTKYKTRQGVPAQGQNAHDSFGSIKLHEEFQEGTKNLKVGDEITLIFHFHQSKDYELVTLPFKSNKPTGVFLTRSPFRPNGIGITVVKVTGIKEEVIEFTGADMLDGTPLLDIKPYLIKTVDFI